MLHVSSRVTSTAPPGVDAAAAGEQPGLPQQVGRPARAELGRDLVEQRAEHRGRGRSSHASQRVDGVGVLGGELRDLLAAPRRVVRQLQVAAVGARREVGALRVDVVAVLLQLQVADQRAAAAARRRTTAR